jgi:hypothetical protein
MTPARQIGEGPDVQLLRQISKQLEKITCLICGLTTDVTTTTAPITTTTTTTFVQG